MALKKCRECGHEVSSSAKTCPNCGKPQAKFFTPLGIIALVGILVIIIIWLTAPPDNQLQSSAPTSMDAYVVATQYIEKRLRNPHSANFLAHAASDIKENGNGIWEVKSYVDAKNDFGGEIRYYYVVKLKHVGNKRFRLEDIKMQRE